MSAVVSQPKGLPALPGVGRGGTVRRPRLRRMAAGDRARGSGLGASGGPGKGVFDIVPMVETTMADVRDAVEACSPCDSADSRRSCFVIFGLDSDKVDKYQWAVEMLLRCMNRKDSGDEDGKGDWLRAPSGP